MDNTFSKRLKIAMERRQISQSELSEKTQIPKSAISQYLSGKFGTKRDRIYDLAQILNVNPAWLTGYDVPMESEIPDTIISSSDNIDSVENGFLIEAKKNQQDTEISEELIPYDKYDNLKPTTKQPIPLIGEIACGEPVYADEHFEVDVAVDEYINADFCLKCKGDSMIDFGIYDGGIVFIHKQPTVENGEIAAVLIDDSATLKKVYYDEDNKKLRLRAGNQNIGDFYYEGEDLTQIKILGKAVKVLNDLR